MDNVTMHSVEHMMATFMRNSSIGDNIIYFGPMGCRTGFYLLVRDIEPARVLSEVKLALNDDADRLCQNMFLGMYSVIIEHAQKTGKIKAPSQNCYCDVITQFKK